MPSLIDLSPEILQLIVENLCIHCQLPNDSPVNCLDAPLGHDGQASLASLCAAHSTLRTIAQPILHHYFLFNPTTKHLKFKILRARIARYFRTLCLRPDLADAVRVLSLSAPSAPDDMGKFPIDKEAWIAYPLLEQFCSAAMGSSLDFRHANPRPVDYKTVCHVLLTVIPNLRKLQCQILLSHSLSRDQKPLESVKHLEINQPTGLSLPAYPHDIIFQTFPAIESLDMTASLNCAHHFDSHDPTPKTCGHGVWEMLPKTLRKITFDHVTITSLGQVFGHCERLEDLSISIHINVNWPWELVSPPNGAFENLRSSLRRLVVDRGNPMMPKDDGLRPDGIYLKPALSLKKLAILEVLEIQHVFLTGEIIRTQNENPNRLSQVLPETLCALHIGYVWDWSTVESQLQDLIHARQTGQFKHLTNVQIDMAEKVSINEDRAAEMVEAFRQVGIVMTTGHSLPSNVSGGRGMLPQSPGEPRT